MIILSEARQIDGIHYIELLKWMGITDGNTTDTPRIHAKEATDIAWRYGDWICKDQFNEFWLIAQEHFAGMSSLSSQGAYAPQ
jgi:hypothetical protein